jgi:hypothetical protein
MKRAALRFACLYAVLYLFPFPFDVFVPALEFSVWRRVTDAVGATLGAWLGFATPAPYYVGDAMIRQLYVAAALAASLAGGIAWAWFDRPRIDEARLASALRGYLRLALAVTLINYGAMKIVSAQFPPLGLDTLYQPIGDASPMGLLWAFMGASQGYVRFTGTLELLAGVLVAFRATAVPGALLAIVALTQILALNLAFDVPQKQFTLHLLLMAGVVVAPDARRLAAVMAGKGVAPAVRRGPFSDTRWARPASVAGAALVAWALAVAVSDAVASDRAIGGAAPRSAMHGVWEVREFNGPAVGGPRWRRIIFDGPERAGLEFEDGSYARVYATFGQSPPTLKMRLETGAMELERIAELSVNHEADRCSMTGTIGGQPAALVLERVERRPFILERRGFRWTSESEFIR